MTSVAKTRRLARSFSLPSSLTCSFQLVLCDAGDSDLCELQTKKCEKNHTQTQTDEKTETTRRREGLRPFTLEDSRLLSPSVLKCSDETVWALPMFRSRH